MSDAKIRDDGKVELNFRVELDPENPRVVVMDLGLERVAMPFDTEEDAKRADLMLSSMGMTTAVLFGVCKAEVLGAPTVWEPGTQEPSTQKAPSAECVAGNGDGADNSTKTQKDGALSCGADGAAPAGQGQGNWEHVGKLPWIVDYCWDIRDANGYVIAKVNENLSEEAYKRMCEFIAAAANATAGPCNAAKLRMALEKMATWANEDGCEYCVGDREEMAKQALEEAPRNCDVGTLDEQIDRFIVFCESHGTCIECELSDGRRARHPSCDLAWGQLPYMAVTETGGAK